VHEPLIVAAEAIPHIQLYALVRELDRALVRQAREDGGERLLLSHSGLEGLLAPEASRDLQGLTAVVAEAREHPHEELRVGNRLTNLERGVPCGQQMQVVLVEVSDRLRVVGRQFLIGDVINPGAYDLPDELPARLAPDRLGDDADGILRLNEAEWHRDSRRTVRADRSDCRRPCGRHFSRMPGAG